MSATFHREDLPIFKGDGNAPRFASQKIFVRFQPVMAETVENGSSASSGMLSKGIVFWFICFSSKD